MTQDQLLIAIVDNLATGLRTQGLLSLAMRVEKALDDYLITEMEGQMSIDEIEGVPV